MITLIMCARDASFSDDDGGPENGDHISRSICLPENIFACMSAGILAVAAVYFVARCHALTFNNILWRPAGAV